MDRPIEPMIPMQRNARALKARYGGVIQPEADALSPWETAFVDWWHFMQDRELVVTLRARPQEQQDSRSGR